jgi:hypothetical protein
LGIGFRASGIGFGFRVYGLVQDSGSRLRAEGSGFRTRGLGLGVYRRPACANTLATQSGNQGMALRHGINTEIAGGGVSAPLFPPGGFSLARPGDPAAATFSAGGCECLSSSPSWLGLLRLQCSDCAAESRA